MEPFRTQVQVPISERRIHYSSRLMFIGSCFSESMADQFAEVKFMVDTNPFGIIYNPLSIKNSLLRLIGGKPFQASDLFQQDELWHSFEHHSRFSGTDKDMVLQMINQRFHDAKESLKNADFLFITFGTSMVYELKMNRKIVANCHKIPSGEFIHRIVTLDEICTEYTTLLQEIFNYNPDVYIVFTVSPIRHLKDGAHENQLSKATLLLAIDQLCKQYHQTMYFPSFELVMDDLRDYRFYNEDMLHPNALAIKYIWEKVKNCFMDSETIRFMGEIEKVVLAFQHRPFNSKSNAFRDFSDKLVENIKILKREYNIDLSKEEQYFRSFL